MRDPITPRELLEPLEPRTHLTATFFAGVGMAFAPNDFNGVGVDVFTVEGDIDNETGTASGDVFKARSGGRDFDQRLRYDRVFYLNDGRQERDDAEGFNDFYDNDEGEVNGAQFLSSRGFGAGWWLGDLNARAQELELMVELGDDVRDRDIEGSYRFTLIGIDLAADNFVSGSGRLDIDDERVRWSPTFGVAPTDADLVSVNDFGIGLTDEDEWFYLSRDQNTVLFADMDTNDDLIYFGFGVRTDTSVAFDDLVGGYNTAWGYVERDARSLGAPENILFEQTYLDLEQDGDYKLYDLDDWDSGIRDEPIEIGFWSVSSGRVTLEIRDTDTERTLYVGEDGNVLLGAAVEAPGPDSAILGIATEAFPPNPLDPVERSVISVPARNDLGREAVYELDDEGEWTQSDLELLTGGPSITGDVVAWIDTKDGLTYAAGVTAEGVALFTRDRFGEWSFTNLTSDLAGDAITRSLDLMIDPRGNAHLVGLGTDGDVLRYFQTGLGEEGSWVWNAQNISEDDLEPNDVETPPFEGELVAFATSWGALNVVGLDADGTIWSVWWAPTLLDWTASDLTTAYGADPLEGGLTVFLTSWSGINIAGIDADGDLRVSWWVPSFGGDWAQTNLTDDLNGPSLAVDSVTSLVSSWDGLTIAGVNTATNEVVTYWWAPALQGTGWRLASLSDATPAGTPNLVTELQGLAGDDASLNVFGYDAAGDFYRYYWQSDFAGVWMAENLIELAEPVTSS